MEECNATVKYRGRHALMPVRPSGNQVNGEGLSQGGRTVEEQLEEEKSQEDEQDMELDEAGGRGMLGGKSVGRQKVAERADESRERGTRALPTPQLVQTLRRVSHSELAT